MGNEQIGAHPWTLCELSQIPPRRPQEELVRRGTSAAKSANVTIDRAPEPLLTLGGAWASPSKSQHNK